MFPGQATLVVKFFTQTIAFINLINYNRLRKFIIGHLKKKVVLTDEFFKR
jgi:hypothetical protein